MTRPCVLALGFFDGVHIGHGGLLRRTRETADRLGVPAAALTFDTHPDTLVSGHSVPLLNTPEDRAALMREYYGIDEVLTLHFDRETMTQPWERFAEETLLGRYHAVHLVCGHDFRFGDRGAGNPEKLAAFCAQRGIGFDRIDVIELDGAPVSSTRIRALLEAGDMAEAVRCLGHPHVLTGPVVSGRHLGRTIGIPTANLALPPQLLCPRHGVYAALACFDGRRLPAVVNIGSRPTVGGTHVTVEPWILDFDGDLYGRTLRLEFYTFLRPERKFDSLDELRAAILNLDTPEPVVVKRRYEETSPEVLAVKAAADLGVLLLDGLADGIWIDAPGFAEDQVREIELMILQAARVRFSHTEYIACPSCGRTLYDIEKTLADIKSRTSHLSNLKIGVMGCIVNGPGEMADADYGYVGAAPGRITLYKGRTVVARNIPQQEALDRLVELIKADGEWVEP